MKLKKVVFILALLIFLGALGYLGVVWYSYYSAGKAYEELEEAVVTRQEGTDTGEEGEGAEAVWEPLTIDFGALQEISENVCSGLTFRAPLSATRWPRRRTMTIT